MPKYNEMVQELKNSGQEDLIDFMNPPQDHFPMLSYDECRYIQFLLEKKIRQVEQGYPNPKFREMLKELFLKFEVRK